jgi:hypothetical protein
MFEGFLVFGVFYFVAQFWVLFWYFCSIIFGFVVVCWSEVIDISASLSMLLHVYCNLVAGSDSGSYQKWHFSGYRLGRISGFYLVSLYWFYWVLAFNKMKSMGLSMVYTWHIHGAEFCSFSNLLQVLQK